LRLHHSNHTRLRSGGLTFAQTSLGVFYEQGRGGLEKDDREAARLYKLAADQGYANAQSNLGNIYRDGRGSLPKDDREAARFYKLAADQGNTFAQASLGVFYEQGRGGLPKDDREAARLYKLAADQGNANAQAALKRLAPWGNSAGFSNSIKHVIFRLRYRGNLRKDNGNGNHASLALPRPILMAIPPKANRKVKRDCDFALYRERNLVECFFNKIKLTGPSPRATTNSLEIFSPLSTWSPLSSYSTDDRP
jgi:TPR repeat protein